MNSFSTALTAMRRSPYQTLVATIMVALTCFVAYTFSLLVVGAQQVLRYFETQPQIIAFFQLNATQDQIIAVENQIKSKPYVEKVTVVNKEEALRLYKEDKQDDPLLLELVTADILPASIEVSGKTVDDLSQISQDLQGAFGVEEVVFQRTIADSLSTWSRSLRLLGGGLSVLLGLTSFLIVMVVIGIKITAKKQAIYIMRMIGATRWYIKRPFMIEGLLYGLVGSILGWGAMYAGLLYLTPWLRNFLEPMPLFPIPYQFLAIQFGIGTAIAMFIGMFAAWTAGQRLIKR